MAGPRTAGKARPSAQRGAVLLTSLMLLLIMTMLAVTTMRVSTMEERMATNSALNNRSFQASESGVDAAYHADNDQPFTEALQNGSAQVTAGGMGSAVTSVATVRLRPFDHHPPCLGSSMGVAQNNGFENRYFDIEAKGHLSSDGETLSTSTITAGVAYCVPAR